MLWSCVTFWCVVMFAVVWISLMCLGVQICRIDGGWLAKLDFPGGVIPPYNYILFGSSTPSTNTPPLAPLLRPPIPLLPHPFLCTHFNFLYKAVTGKRPHAQSATSRVEYRSFYMGSDCYLQRQAT